MDNPNLVVDLGLHAADEAQKAIIRVAETAPTITDRGAVAMVANNVIAGKTDALNHMTPDLAEFASDVRKTSADATRRSIGGAIDSGRIADLAAKAGIDVKGLGLDKLRDRASMRANIELDASIKEFEKAGHPPEMAKLFAVASKAAAEARRAILRVVEEGGGGKLAAMTADIAACALIGGYSDAAKGFDPGITNLIDAMRDTGRKAKEKTMEDAAAKLGESISAHKTA